MSLNCGIVGLPNVGKSTIFSAITSAKAEAANYPFCTIDPNFGIVNVPDDRLKKISSLFNPKETIPAIVEFVDIAGLVKGASQGEGLGNQFLSNIRQVKAIAHIVRCFDDSNVTHVHETIDPVRDIEIINLELALADLDVVEKRLISLEKQLRSQNKKSMESALILKPLLEQLVSCLKEGKPARSLGLNPEEEKAIKDLQLITMKKVLYVCNIDESSLVNKNSYVLAVEEYARQEDSEVIVICGQVEADISTLENEIEKKEFMESLGIKESGLDQLIKAAYKMLDLRTYFTAGPKEVKAWTFKEGNKAPDAAAIIHNDFAKGFIRAEVYSYDDLISFGSEQKVKEGGKLRVEGKEYLVQDGDIIHFLFNV